MHTPAFPWAFWALVFKFRCGVTYSSGVPLSLVAVGAPPSPHLQSLVVGLTPSPCVPSSPPVLFFASEGHQRRSLDDPAVFVGVGAPLSTHLQSLSESWWSTTPVDNHDPAARRGDSIGSGSPQVSGPTPFWCATITSGGSPAAGFGLAPVSSAPLRLSSGSAVRKTQLRLIRPILCGTPELPFRAASNSRVESSSASRSLSGLLVGRTPCWGERRSEQPRSFRKLILRPRSACFRLGTRLFIILG